MNTTHDNQEIKSPTLRRWIWANRNFCIAALILGISWGGWELIVTSFKLVMEKSPVRWTAVTKVDPEDCRMTELATSFGPYRRLEDGELSRDPRNPVKDGKPDGEGYCDEATREALGIGTGADLARVEHRDSGWYVMRTYVDTSKSANDPCRYWSLQVTYYTGRGNRIPHVPERCLVAGAMRVTERGEISFNVPGVRAKWNDPKKLIFRKVFFESVDPLRKTTGRRAQFYAFSYNGQPESNWKVIRTGIKSPFREPHAYFAKIQFEPLRPVASEKDLDEAAGDFIKHFLPEVLKFMPTSEDVKNMAKKPNK